MPQIDIELVECVESHIEHILGWSELCKQLQGASIVIRIVLLGYSVDLTSVFPWSLQMVPEPT